MVRTKNKKPKQASENRLGLLAAFLFLVQLAALVWAGLSIWTLDSHAVLAPPSDQIFLRMNDFLGGKRIILPSELLFISLFFLSYIPTLIWLVWTFLIRLTLSGKNSTRLLVSLLLASSTLPLAIPGELSARWVEIVWTTALILPLVAPLSWTTLWMLSTLALGAAWMSGSSWMTIYWTSLSLLFGGSLHFLFAEKAHLLRSQRRSLLRFVSDQAAYLLLGLWIILTVTAIGLDKIDFTPSSRYWAPFLISSLLVFLAWRRPWQSKKWMSLVIMVHGMLLSRQLETATWLLGAWILIQVLTELVALIQSKAYLKKPLGWVKQITPFALLAVILYSTIVVIRREPAPRTLNTSWISIAREIQKEPPQSGYLIFGNSLYFLAQFHPGLFIRDPSLATERSQENLLAWMKDKKIDSILIEREYLQNLWTRWIQDGNNPEYLNETIFSRSLLYDGEAVKTATLHLPPIVDFEKQPIKNRDVIWLKRKNP